MNTMRRKYSKEFKLEAIRMYENGERTITEVEHELGITAGFASILVGSITKENINKGCQSM